MRLLLVEDDLPLAEALTAPLAGSGHAVDCVHDGLWAETLLLAEQFELVIPGLNLPGLDGLRLLKRNRAGQPWPAVMMLTARIAPEERVRSVARSRDWRSWPGSRRFSERTAGLPRCPEYRV